MGPVGNLFFALSPGVWCEATCADSQTREITPDATERVNGSQFPFS